MRKINRKDIYTINRHSNWSEEDVQIALQEHVLSKKASWETFLRLFLISLGIAFTVSGVIFFFAYNWDDLGNFMKFGLVEGLLIVTTIVAILPKIKPNIRNIILTGASMLVGVLFAIFGQVYQTGANAYDFFLMWTLFVTIWAFVANFSVMWLAFLVLINTTFVLYTFQVNGEWSFVLVCLFLFLFNGLILALFTKLPNSQLKLNSPNWLNNIIGLATVSCSTLGIIVGIFDDESIDLPILLILSGVLYTLGILYGLKARKIFYLAVIPFSIIMIIFSFIIDVFHFDDGAFVYFILGLMIVVSITALIVQLVNLKKRWSNE